MTSLTFALLSPERQVLCDSNTKETKTTCGCLENSSKISIWNHNVQVRGQTVCDLVPVSISSARKVAWTFGSFPFQF